MVVVVDVDGGSGGGSGGGWLRFWIWNLDFVLVIASSLNGLWVMGLNEL